MPSPEQVVYNRPMPPEWQPLLADVQGVVQDHTKRPFDRAAATYAFTRANELGTEELETNAYYGLGLGMCDIALVLRDPESRAGAASEIAGHLTENNVHLRSLLDRPNAEIAIGDLAMPALLTIGSLAQRNYNRIAPELHLLSDALTIAMRVRRAGTTNLLDPFMYNLTMRRVAQGDASVRIIASNGLAASANLHRRALLAKRGVTPDTQIEDMDPLDLLKVARQSAGIHSEEFNTPSFLDELLVPNENGQLVFNRAILPKEVGLPKPGDDKRTEILHAQRLGCPAVQVVGLIEGVVRFIPDVIRAQG